MISRNRQHMEGIGLIDMEDNKYYQRMINLRDCLHRDTTIIKDGVYSSVSQCNNCGLFVVNEKKST